MVTVNSLEVAQTLEFLMRRNKKFLKAFKQF